MIEASKFVTFKVELEDSISVSNVHTSILITFYAPLLPCSYAATEDMI